MAEDPNTAAYATDVLENTSPGKGPILLAAANDLHKVGAEQHADSAPRRPPGTVEP